MIIRELHREEIERIWTIDRGEVIEAVYQLQDGHLVLTPEHFDASGWPPGEQEVYAPILLDCCDRGGFFWGVIDGSELAAVAVLDNKRIGRNADQLQLKFLHVSRSHRGQGLGRTLFYKAAQKAKELNARQLYISATPSENTINFYLSLGCVVTRNPDPELFELEPEDIHLEFTIPTGVL